MLFYIQPKIIKKLDEDGHLRTKLAVAMMVTERGVYNMVKRYIEKPAPNSNLTKKAVLEFFKTEGYSEDEILTKDKPAE